MDASKTDDPNLLKKDDLRVKRRKLKVEQKFNTSPLHCLLIRKMIKQDLQNDDISLRMQYLHQTKLQYYKKKT